MRKSVTQLAIQKGKEPLVFVTAYDYLSAKLVDPFVDCILVGDSLGMVIQGNETTLPVTLDEMIYHTKAVVRGSKQAFVLTDLPFMSYQASIRDAKIAAGRVLKESGAQAIKIEGGFNVLEQISAITRAGVPVFGHLGLTPQSIHQLGSYKKQAKDAKDAEELTEAAFAIQEVGAVGIVLENIPHDLAKEVTESLRIPTIGIGAGKDCDGQVQVFHDLLGYDPDFTPKHAVKYQDLGRSIQKSIQNYSEDVRSKSFLSK